MGWKLILLPLLALSLLAMTGTAAADDIEVDLDAPDYARSGETVPVTIEIEHEDTAPGRYVDTVRLYDGDTLLKEWRYGPDDYVKAEEWTLSYSGAFDRDAYLRATAHSTVYGDDTDTERIRIR
ncbi:MAG: hypothetical protein A4E28_01214 [Methanocella sp. PtaU1.Bin125]|nr:MAG: hypothetical protein A4E28_01214 [Methanocella sp. PtaU1.Bin125]